MLVLCFTHIGTSGPLGARRVEFLVKKLPSWRQTWLQEGENLYIAKKGGANFGAQEGGDKNIYFTEGEPTLAPRRVGTKIFFHRRGANFGAQELSLIHI